MILLSCDKISKSFGVDIVLEDITFSVSEGTRMGIVGTNGAGKTTLFKLITEALPFDSGNLYKTKDLTIGYLEQRLPFTKPPWKSKKKSAPWSTASRSTQIRRIRNTSRCPRNMPRYWSCLPRKTDTSMRAT